MDVHREKLRALLQFAAMVQGSPALVLLLGFLAGQIDRVHFVSDLGGAPVAIRLSSGRRRIWPSPPFEATLRGVNVPDPVTLVSALSGNQDPICLSIEFEGAQSEAWYQNLVVPRYIDVAAGRTAEHRAAEHRLEDLRRQIDHALDVYNECRRLLEEGDPAREAELQIFKEMAERELKECSEQLARLESTLQKRL